MVYVHPTKAGNSIRVMPGKPHSKWASQRKPYVIREVNGRVLDKYGEKLSTREYPEAHIPLEEF
jgi:hypothetical protein